MHVVALPERTKTSRTTTTLFDLIDAMQQHVTTPLDEALIVPTIVDLLHSGRLRFEGKQHRQMVAEATSEPSVEVTD
jgi:hypothetical protein